jgi:hypothetical protein
MRSGAFADTMAPGPETPRPAAAMRHRAASAPAQPRRHRRQHRRSVRAELQRMVAQKTFKERLTELTGSMLLASIVSGIVSLLVLALMGQLYPDQYVWLWGVATLASWCVMVPAKVFEGKVEDQSPRRFVQLVLGLGVGFAAWGLSHALLLDLPHDLNFEEPLVREMMEVPRETFRTGKDVPLALSMGYFGFLFLMLRWWTQAEWTRYTRLSVWALAVSVTAAMLLQMFWWFPQPAGAMVAGVMAVSIQLSSPWLSIGRRREIVQELHAA